jgi:hypothetical protein
MRADDLLCSRNARSKTPLVGRAQWKINQPPSLGEKTSRLGSMGIGAGQVPFVLAEGGGRMTSVLISCSRSAHDQNVFARRPQGDQHGCHSWESETSNLGRVNEMGGARLGQERVSARSGLGG